MCQVTCGSSPLARGTRCLCAVGRAGLRLIPARAGNTPEIDLATNWHAAHPRSRGEHRTRSAPDSPIVGSSPLARGTLLSRITVPAGDRLIPARAGNTYAISSFSATSSAHPRSRGEHGMRMPRVSPSCGSSPLARGTLTPTTRATATRGSSPLARGARSGQVQGSPEHRLIPARAGNT